MSARPLLYAISLLSLATACTTTRPEPANAPGGGKPAAEPGAPAERWPAGAPGGPGNAHPPAGGEAAHARRHGHGPSGNGDAHEGPHGDRPSEHKKHHAHGSAGYDMDFSSTDRFAAHFDDPARDAWQKPDEVVRLLDVKPGQTVVDLGAGTGYFEAVLSEAVGESGRVIALDTEPNMVEHLQERARTNGWKNGAKGK